MGREAPEKCQARASCDVRTVLADPAGENDPVAMRHDNLDAPDEVDTVLDGEGRHDKQYVVDRRDECSEVEILLAGGLAVPLRMVQGLYTVRRNTLQTSGDALQPTKVEVEGIRVGCTW